MFQNPILSLEYVNVIFRISLVIDTFEKRSLINLTFHTPINNKEKNDFYSENISLN